MGEAVLETLLGAGLPRGLQHPVQRQADDDDDEQQHAVQLHSLEAAAFEHVVVEVRLAVGGQLDLRADLLARRPRVERGVQDPTEQDHQGEDPGDRGGRQREHVEPPRSMRATKRLLRSDDPRPAWPGNAMNVI